MGFGHYILDGHTPVRENDLMTWARWMATHERHVAKDTVAGVEISTVFLGIDHNYFGRHDDPILFETMLFGLEDSLYQMRCSTWAEAVEMHAVAVAFVKAGAVTANAMMRKFGFARVPD